MFVMRWTLSPFAGMFALGFLRACAGHFLFRP
jgi:hypothetical protein